MPRRATPRRSSDVPETPLHVLGATLRRYRRSHGLTQLALAAKTGLHVMYISEIERGQRNVSVLTLLRLAAALQLPAATLLQPLETRPELYLTCDPVPPN